MDGQPRIMDGYVDMGAYENPGMAEPIADFSAEPLSGQAPLTVNFTDKSGGTIDSWEWDFGDGSPLSYEQNPSHVYDTPGTFTVTLIVSGPYGSDTEIKADYITVGLENPKVKIKANGQNGPVFVSPNNNVNITVSLDPRSMQDVNCDWWVAGLTTSGTYWLNPSLNWVKSDNPISVLQAPLYGFPMTSLLNTPLPVGVYTFFFIVDNSPDGNFNMTAGGYWGDYLNLFCSANGTENNAAIDLDSILRGTTTEIFKK